MTSLISSYPDLTLDSEDTTTTINQQVGVNGGFPLEFHQRNRRDTVESNKNLENRISGGTELNGMGEPVQLSDSDDSFGEMIDINGIIGGGYELSGLGGLDRFGRVIRLGRLGEMNGSMGAGGASGSIRVGGAAGSFGMGGNGETGGYFGTDITGGYFGGGRTSGYSGGGGVSGYFGAGRNGGSFRAGGSSETSGYRGGSGTSGYFGADGSGGSLKVGGNSESGGYFGVGVGGTSGSSGLGNMGGYNQNLGGMEDYYGIYGAGGSNRKGGLNQISESNRMSGSNRMSEFNIDSSGIESNGRTNGFDESGRSGKVNGNMNYGGTSQSGEMGNFKVSSTSNGMNEPNRFLKMTRIRKIIPTINGGSLQVTRTPITLTWNRK